MGKLIDKSNLQNESCLSIQDGKNSVSLVFFDECCFIARSIVHHASRMNQKHIFAFLYILINDVISLFML